MAGDRDPDGLLAVTAMLSYLAEDFAEIGNTPNPAEVSARPSMVGSCSCPHPRGPSTGPSTP